MNHIWREMRTFLLVICLASSGLKIYAQPPSHDPSRLMKDGERYYEFYTANGIAVLSASDAAFKDWQTEPSVFGSSWPAWINDYVPDFAGLFWAPDCVYMNGKYYLYYACSTFGSEVSAIGLATSPSLNNPTWTDQGMVIHSDGSNMDYNTIDPSILKDDDGSVWLTFGSFFGGIAVIELDSVTGKTTGTSTKIAGGNGEDIEASYLMKHDGYYYLFVNRGFCCRGVNSTYYIQMGRSATVTGPYTDWQTFLHTEGRYIGPGHFGYNEGRLTYHIYDRDDNGASKLINTTLSWSNGWPVAGAVSQEPQGTVIPNGTYRISAYDSTKIVGVTNNAPAQGSNIQLWQYTTDGIAGQSWTMNNIYLHNYKISPENYADLTFDVYNCLPDDGAKLDLWTYWGGKCQQWNFEDRGDDLYRIRSVLSNKCLEVAGVPIAAGANLFQNSCDSSNENQLFKLKLLEAGSPTIYSFTSQQFGYPVSNILDGNNADDSRWSADGFPQSVVIDYGENKSITGTRVWTYQGVAYQYTVDLDDNPDFTSPYTIDRTSNTDASQPISDDFNAVTARYARLTVTGATVYTGTKVGINEFDIVEEHTTGVKTPFSNDKTGIALYPNPADDILHIAVSAKPGIHAKLTIYNTVGEVVLTRKISGTIASLDLSHLNSGIYMIVVSHDQRIVTKSFVKQ